MIEVEVSMQKSQESEIYNPILDIMIACNSFVILALHLTNWMVKHNERKHVHCV